MLPAEFAKTPAGVGGLFELGICYRSERESVRERERARAREGEREREREKRVICRLSLIHI